MVQNIIHSDLNSKNPRSKALVTNYDAIIQSINTFINTKKGQRVFRPKIGLNYDESIFDLMSDTLASKLYSDFVDQIEEFEPRVEINEKKSSVTPDYENNTYNVFMVFKIKGLEEEFEASSVIS